MFKTLTLVAVAIGLFGVVYFFSLYQKNQQRLQEEARQLILEKDQQKITPRYEGEILTHEESAYPGTLPVKNSSGVAFPLQGNDHSPQDTEKKILPDTTSTLESPVKVATKDGKQYFLVGQPMGQNGEGPRKIIFSLPGHGSTAEQDYAAWKPQLIENGTYALASLNWWDGEGEKINDYYRPDEVLAQIKAFLETYGYTADDRVILSGFSRGSANTYPVKAYDGVSGTPIIDAVISASGKYQSDFPLTPHQSNSLDGKIYQGVPWVLVCGERDDNPERDGCIGMEETRSYLTQTGAEVLALLKDPQGGHGAFHQSPLKLARQALELLDAKLIQEK
jgi:hypothetical protein